MIDNKTDKPKELIPGYTVVPLICTLVLQTLVFSGTKLITAGVPHHNFESGLDLAIPFLPWTVLIYTGAFLYWVLAFRAILCSGKDNAFRFLCAHITSLLICLVFFLFLPTTNTRPTPEGNGLWDWGMRLVYALDTPQNLFPSLHCQLSWLCCRCLYQAPGIRKFWKRFSLVFTLLVFVSTLTTKQHTLIDVAGGWLVGELAYRLCGNRKLTKPFYQIFDR